MTVSGPLYGQADMYFSFVASVSPASRMRENKESTSGLEPLTCSLRVCGQWLLVVAGVCISRISKRFSVPSFARYCSELRPG